MKALTRRSSQHRHLPGASHLDSRVYFGEGSEASGLDGRSGKRFEAEKTNAQRDKKGVAGKEQLQVNSPRHCRPPPRATRASVEILSVALEVVGPPGILRVSLENFDCGTEML